MIGKTQGNIECTALLSKGGAAADGANPRANDGTRLGEVKIGIIRWATLAALTGAIVVLSAYSSSSPQDVLPPPDQEAFQIVDQSLDTEKIWAPLSGAGYLAFRSLQDPPTMEMIPIQGSIPPYPLVLSTEEDTGWCDPNGYCNSDFALGVDNHKWAGNRIDFDWVRENRIWERDHMGLHKMHTGLLLFWIRDDPPHSPHKSGSMIHDHGNLGELVEGDYGNTDFNRVDVFSIAFLRGEQKSPLETDQGVRGERPERASALDYDLWFVNLGNSECVHGIPLVVFAPGWNPQTWFDDYVARWKPAQKGKWNAVAIEPHKGDGRDDVCEIDAVIAAKVP